MEFLGHVVNAQGVAPTTKHLATIAAIEPPTSGKQIASLVGFLQYYSSFLPRFAKLTAPLNALRNKKRLGPGDWTPDCQQALDELKESFAKEGLIKHYPLNESATSRGSSA